MVSYSNLLKKHIMPDHDLHKITSKENLTVPEAGYLFPLHGLFRRSYTSVAAVHNPIASQGWD